MLENVAAAAIAVKNGRLPHFEATRIRCAAPDPRCNRKSGLPILLSCWLCEPDIL